MPAFRANPIQLCEATGMAPRSKRPTTTPEQEGIEMRPDAWPRFVRALKTIARHTPKDRIQKKAKRAR